MGDIKLTDKNYMPFGKYSKPPHGPKQLKDVPAGYFHWLWHSNKERIGPVFDYIRENMSAMKKEDPDKEWED